MQSVLHIALHLWGGPGLSVVDLRVDSVICIQNCVTIRLCKRYTEHSSLHGISGINRYKQILSINVQKCSWLVIL